MAQPYLAHFALKEPPFSKEVPDAELWLPSSKPAIVDTLLEALDEHSSVVLVGEPALARRASCVRYAIASRPPASGSRTDLGAPCDRTTLTSVQDGRHQRYGPAAGSRAARSRPNSSASRA